MKWRCPKCGLTVTEDPRKGKQKAHCPKCCGKIAWMQVIITCPCGQEFHPDHYDTKTCSKKCRYKYSRNVTDNPKKGRHYPHLQKAGKRKCIVCGIEFRTIKDHINRKQKYCSKACWNVRNPPTFRNCKYCGKGFAHRDSPGYPGIYCTKNCYDNDPTSQQRMRKEELAPAWKGEDAGYSAVHKFIASRLGKPMVCEDCGKRSDSPHNMHWANRDHQYSRELDDWMRLCASCHRRYDLAQGLYGQ